MVRAADERANLALQNGHLLGAVEATHLEGVPRHTAGRRLARIRRVDLRCAAAASLPPALRRGLELVGVAVFCFCVTARVRRRSEEHTSELQSLMRLSYAVFCLKKKKSSQ